MNARARAAVVLVAAVLAAGVTARLGLWQLSRAAEKTALQQQIDARAGEPALTVPALARDAAEAEAQHYRPVMLRGRWLASRTVYLDNRQMDGHPGFFVLTPLLLAPGDAVLVQRGWLPRDAQDRMRLAPVITPDGEVEVAGRIAPPPARLYDFAHDEHGTIRQNLELGAYAREIGVALRPVTVQETSADTGVSGDGLERHWPHPAVEVARHHGYAFQWFALSALIAGLYVWFQLVRPRLHRTA